MEVVRVGPDSPEIEEVRRIEVDVLEFDRGDELRWLASCARATCTAAAESRSASPSSARMAAGRSRARRDRPGRILSHVESRASELGVDELGLELPMVNEVAIRHLLDRGFRFDPFYTFLMSTAVRSVRPYLGSRRRVL